MWLLSLIPTRLQYWAIVILATIAGIFGVYWLGGQNAKHKLQNKLNEKRIESIKVAKEVENEVESLSNDNLLSRASKWVRNSKK